MAIVSRSAARSSFIVNAPRRRRVEHGDGDIRIDMQGVYVLRRKPRWRRGVLALMALAVAGCSLIGLGGPSQPSAPTSVQTVEYYPYQVKGYQNSYPHRTIVVLLPADSRDLNGPNAAAKDGQIGRASCRE